MGKGGHYSYISGLGEDSGGYGASLYFVLVLVFFLSRNISSFCSYALYLCAQVCVASSGGVWIFEDSLPTGEERGKRGGFFFVRSEDRQGIPYDPPCIRLQVSQGAARVFPGIGGWQKCITTSDGPCRIHRGPTLQFIKRSLGKLRPWNVCSQNQPQRSFRGLKIANITSHAISSLLAS